MSSAERTRAYTTTLEPLPGDKARVPVPFDPNQAWGVKRVHHVNGTIAGTRVRVTIAQDDTGWSFSLSPARLRQASVGPGDDVEVVISPEGPQRGDLAPDLSAALDANPAAGAFFAHSPSSTETATCGGSTGRSDGPTLAPNESPR